jgi:hypothetical protein
MTITEQGSAKRIEDSRERDNPLIRYRLDAVEARLDALIEGLTRWAESTDVLTEGERVALLRRLTI